MLDLALIGGRIVDERGVPVGRALVGARGPRDTSVGRSNERGRFTLGIIASEPVRVLARKPGYVIGIEGGVEPGTLDVVMVLRRGGSVSGRVIGDPLPARFDLRVLRWERHGRVPASMASVHRREGGCFSVTRLPSGVYEIAAGRDSVVVDVDAGESVDGVELRL